MTLRVPVRSANGGASLTTGAGDLHGAGEGANDPRTRVDGERLGDVPAGRPERLVEGDSPRLDHRGLGGERRHQGVLVPHRLS